MCGQMTEMAILKPEKKHLLGLATEDQKVDKRRQVG
jgi:hypothetical protein